MTLPSHVQIGPLRYSVVCDDHAVLERSRDESTDLLGHADHRKLEITVRPEQAPDMLADTVLHEALHAVFSMTGIERMFDDEDTAESLVNRLSPALLDMLRRNPDLVAFLLDGGTS